MTSASVPYRRRPAGQGRLLCAALSAACCILLSGCDIGFLGETEADVVLEGERIPVLALRDTLSVDPAVARRQVSLPTPVRNTAWPQPGGNAAHAMGHLEGPIAPREVWQVDIGSGSGSDAELQASPVIAGGRIFTLDADGELRVFHALTGELLWEQETAAPDEEDVIFPGAITTGDGLVFAANGAGQVMAFDAGTGEELWRAGTPGPVRSAPTYSDGRLFVTTIDNQAVGLSAATGDRFWVHSGISEVTALLGNASPAVKDTIVVVPYSSGEIYALAVETGRVFWIDSLRRVRRSTTVAGLADIRGNPVIDRDRVIAVSHSGRTSALDFRTGARIWGSAVGSTQTPWVAGEFVYLASNRAEVVCLTRDRGQVRWFTELPRYRDEEDQEDPILYFGPVVASDRVLVASSHGILYLLSAETGAVTGTLELDDDVFIPPVVANGMIYVLTDNGRLTAYR